MTAAHVRACAAWAPGLPDADAWRRFATEGGKIAHAGAPDVSFVPAMLRRRCDLLSRMMLAVAHACAADACVALDRVPSVFASRHGSFATAIALLEEVARGESLSPFAFSHSVHNAQAGLFSLQAQNRAPSVAIAAGAETFAAGLLEALLQVSRADAPVLLVAGDETVPEAMLPISDHAPPPHAVALLLAQDGPGPRLTLELQAADAGPGHTRGTEANARSCVTEATDAIVFATWWHGADRSLVLAHPPRRFTLTRA
jgi:hypothetical protein